VDLDLVTGLQNERGERGRAAACAKSTLEALGYICEEIEHEHLQETDVNAMLTAIVQGMRKEEGATRSGSPRPTRW
jgi:importin subunit beta-1